MEYRNMGKTGLKLSVLSFGSWISFHNQVDNDLADKLMGIAYEQGVNFFDNAEVYADGESEKLMGEVLAKKNWDRTSYVLSSKAFFGWHGKNNKPNQYGLSRKHLIEACNEALKRLKVDYLDLYFCHRPDTSTPVEEIVWAMNTLLQQGKILYWGTSEWSAVEVMKAYEVANKLELIGPVVEQQQYNLFTRNRVEAEFRDIYKSIGLGTTTWSPLASGLLTGKYNNAIPSGSRFSMTDFEWLKNRWISEENIEKVKNLTQLAENLSTTLPILSIAWCMKNENVSSVILGATNENQLEENLKSLEFAPQLSKEVLSEIDEIMKEKLKD